MGNDLRLEKNRSKYDLCKYIFTNKVVNICNSLRNDVVLCDTVNKLTGTYQDTVYDYKAEIHGTGGRSSHY